MASANVVQLSDATFQKDVLESEVPVLVDFWAEWCGPCRMLAPTIDQLAEEYAGRVKVGKVDTEANRAITGKYGITAIPTVIVFHKGQVAKRMVGLPPGAKNVLKAALDAVAAAPK